MGITLQEYRISIGTYSKSGLPKFGNKNKQTTYKDKQDAGIERNSKRLLLCKLIVCFLVHLSLNAALLTNLTDERSHCMDANQMKTVTQICLKTFPQNLQERQSTPQYETWASSSCLGINKLCHILYGYRRNLGYKYFSWNCDRAYLSKNKIEDVKQIAIRHKPHFIGISEVNLRRNEHAPNDNENNNEFSTEQVHEKLKIEGYRLFLPASWVNHNKARLIVYVDENISVKLGHNPSHSSHIQNILLEVGFGKTKKHFVSFYYRECKRPQQQGSSN